MAIDVYEEVPPSPTLTNPDMILPSLPGDTILGMNAPMGSGLTVGAIAPRSSVQVVSGIPRPAYYQPRRYDEDENPEVAFASFSSYAPTSVKSTKQSSPSVVIRASSPTTSTDTTPTRRAYGSNAGVLASSPTLRMLGDNIGAWPMVDGRPRSGVSSVSSELSEDLERWAASKAALADADGNESVVTAEEDDDQFDKSGGRGRAGEKIESSPLARLRGEADEDFLSRRAEIILANAKSRLKMMEGNLKGARHSLSSNSLSNRNSNISSKIGGRGTGSAGHSRAVSEVSLPAALPTMPSPRMQNTLPQRASSALGNFGPGLSLLNRGGSLRGARSQEAMRENRLKNWIMDDRDRSALPTFHHTPNASTVVEQEQRPVSSHRKSPTPSELHRPVSQASSIRAQMDELKDRIHQIKERANQNNRRVSAMDGPDSRLHPADALGRKSESPAQSLSHTTGPGPMLEDNNSFLNVDDDDDDDEEQDEDEDDDWLGASEVDVDLKSRAVETPDYEGSTYEDAEETLADLEGTLQDHRTMPHASFQKYPHGKPSALNGVVEEELYERFEGESESGATEYYEAEQVLAGRHEDRFDAFDYQNMFLHSAMSSAFGRRTSYSSESSVETTRPASPLRTNQAKEATSPPDDTNYFEDDIRPASNRLSIIPDRNMSSISISTAASFATAVGGAGLNADGIDDDDHEDGLDDADVLEAAIGTAGTAKLNKITRPMLTIPRADAIIPSPQRSPNLSSPSKQQRGSMLLGSPPAFLPTTPPKSAGGSTQSVSRKSSGRTRPSSGLLSSFIGLDNVAASQETIQKDRALVESVVGALQRCCLELQRAPEERRAVLRERLAETKKTLAELLEVSSPRPMSS